VHAGGLAVSAKYAEWFDSKPTNGGRKSIGLVCKFMLGMGLGFEMPVVILTRQNRPANYQPQKRPALCHWSRLGLALS
jgi:hypothetical protein